MDNTIENKTLGLLREAREAADVMDTQKAQTLLQKSEYLRVFADFQHLNEGGYGDNPSLRRSYIETRKQVLSCLVAPTENLNNLLRELQSDIDGSLETGKVTDPQRYVALLPDLELAQVQYEKQSVEWRRYMKAKHAINFLDALYSAVNIDSLNPEPYLIISPEQREGDVDHAEEDQKLKDNREIIEANAKIRRIEKMLAALNYLEGKEYFQSMDTGTRSGTVRLMCNWISNQIFGIDRILGKGTEEKYRAAMELIQKKFIGE